MDTAQRRTRGLAAGFSLMELMVGMTIGMVAVIVIIQVMSFFEAQRRTTTGSADAQSNGGIALFAISRELQMAGYPLMATIGSPLECTTLTSNVAGIAAIGPIALTNGTATGSVAASDSITIRYGTTLTGGAPTQITSMVGNAATVGTNLGCQANDITLVQSGLTCAISRATAVSAVGVSPISVTLENTASAAPGTNLSCLGAWNEITYAVNPATGNLDRTAVVNGVSTTTPSVVGVVNLQAQYGIAATASSNQVTQWVDATTGGIWAAPTVANRNRIKAVRIAVVARNAKAEQEVVSTACSALDAASPTGLCAWEGSVASPAPAVDLSPGNASWDRYRYRVFETIIPLRNVIWSKDAL